MRNKLLILFLLILSLLVCSCSHIETESSKTQKVNEQSSKYNSASCEQRIDTSSKNSLSLPENQNSNNKKANTKPPNSFNIDGIQGKIKNVFYGKNNNVIIYADKLYLYDTLSNAIVSKSENKYSIIQINQTNYGYSAVSMEIIGGGMFSDNNNKDDSIDTIWNCIFYDEALNVQSIVTLSDVVKDEKISCISITADGNKVAFSSENGISVYDCSKKNTSQIISLADAGKVNGLCFIEELHFANDKRLVFKGGSFNTPIVAGAKSFTTYGMVGIDSSNFINNKNEKYAVGEKLQVYNKFTLIPEFFMKSTGKVLLMDTATGNETTHTLTCKSEGKDGVFGSDKGVYFATASLGKELIVRIYETQSGKLLTEEEISDTNKAYFYSVPTIRLLDDSKTCIVVLGKNQEDIKTKTAVFSF